MRPQRFRHTLVHLTLALAILVSMSGSLAPTTAQAAGAHSAGPAAPAPAPAGSNGTAWCVAGGFQGWDNTSHPMNDDGAGGDLFAGDGIYSLDASVPSAGREEFKIVECGNWGNAHPTDNAWFFTSSPNQVVKFSIDTNDHSGDAGSVSLPAQLAVNAWGDDLPTGFTAVGDFQGWNNADPATALTDLGRGIFRLAYDIPNAGAYIGKITATGSWDAFGADGRSVNAQNVNFGTSAPNETVIFLLDTNTGRLTIETNGSGTGNWCLAGGFQGWDNASHALYDDGTNGDLLGGDGVFSLDFSLPNAGREEWKIVECGNWGNAFPANNAWVLTSTPNQAVKFTFDTNDHTGDAGLALVPAVNIVNAWDDLPASFTAVGDFQGWDNANPATAMNSFGHGWFGLVYPFPTAGTYQGKVTQTGSWGEQFAGDGRSNDGPNLSFQVFSDNDTAQFALDGYQGRLAILTPPPSGAGHDNNIFWADLGHDSRDALYRVPGAAVPTGTSVTLRLRAASGDLTGAQVRVWNDRQDSQSFLDMSLAAADGTYEWWEAALPASSEPTIYWYRFIAVDGTATAYYEDDATRDGGWGEAFGTSPDYGWQLTVFDPAFQTPDWVKNAVIYQIFPDRFRDGDPGNNTPAGTFFYNEPGGTIVRSNQSDWNRYICDPRDAADCPGTYSKNFYGGDLQGIIDKLDYLQSLGVTALYLNPIFESPSNHKYDTTDFSVIDDNYGDLALFQTLATELKNRGMRLILDGVFNHSSSDSLYFDRYQRYPPPDGACESTGSPYRAWYSFRNAPVPGSGPCAGDTTYEAWFGFDSLPKLDSANQDVRDLIWDGGPGSIARYWMQWADGWRLDVAGDVDPGTTNDPRNDYWEGFRSAVHQTNPDAYIVGEEWAIATAWTLGSEWDATMNYQFSSALLSFWRDTPFSDNDHNAGSSAGILSPLSPSELDRRLHNLQERYPPEAFYAMMNLLGSHDTNRPLFMLDSNTDQNDPALYLDPNYDWSDAASRLEGVALLQMTLPGAPTIYYGDEVGLVGPVHWTGSVWEDDPYNRQPFPWLDESGTPFYTHLQTQAGQDQLRNVYVLLTAARNSHPALRTGSFDTLLVDDAAQLYGYGRKLPDHSDAAVVLVNRADSAQSAGVDVSGYLPYGTQLVDVLDGNAPYTVSPSGGITLTLPARGGALLVLSTPITAAPTAVSDLAVTGQSDGQVDLAWSAVAGADSYNVYRSLLSGGGYALAANTAGTSYSDSGLSNATAFYYVVVARNAGNGLISSPSNEAVGIPQHDLNAAFFNLQWPYEIFHTISAANRTENIYGQIWISGVTSNPGPTAGIRAQVGYGPQASQPSDPGWSWEEMAFNTDSGNNDEFAGSLLPDMLGDHDYTTRWSSDGGRTWRYADRNGPGYIVGQGGLLHVLPSSDTTPPGAPTSLALVSTTASSISMDWLPNIEADLAGYELFRQNSASPGYQRIAQLDTAGTSFVDTGVTTGETYDYYLLAFDTSFNRSGPSNVLQATAQARLVTVTFQVRVPDYTPGTVYLVGSIPELGPWDPGRVPMTQAGADTWTHTLDILDGTSLEYKYTRGSWDMVESWGSITGLNNRQVNIDFGASGTQLVDNTATDWGSGPDDEKAVRFWRDPLVVDHQPPAGAVDVPLDSQVFVTWSIPMPATTDFAVDGPLGPVSGTFAYTDTTQTVTFTPDAQLEAGIAYTATVAGQTSIGVPGGDTGVQQVPVSWSFQTHILTTEELIRQLIHQVEVLIADSELNSYQGKYLLTRLRKAIEALDRGRPRLAIIHLRLFTFRVHSLVRRNILTPQQAQPLLDGANQVIAMIRSSL